MPTRDCHADNPSTTDHKMIASEPLSTIDLLPMTSDLKFNPIIFVLPLTNFDKPIELLPNIQRAVSSLKSRKITSSRTHPRSSSQT